MDDRQFRLGVLLPAPLRQPLYRVLQGDPAERHPSAAELEAELRAHLARLGAYGAREAAEEIGQVLTRAGEHLLGLEGRSVAEHRQRTGDERSTQP